MFFSGGYLMWWKVVVFGITAKRKERFQSKEDLEAGGRRWEIVRL